MKDKDFISALFFAALSIFLISIWFKEGLLFGGGDVGLPTYNPERILKIIRFTWWDVSAPGFPRPHGVAGIPLYIFLASLQRIGLSYVAIQATLFGLILFLMGIGAYLVARETFGSESRLLAMLSGVIYIFNPYMMVQVWHRFVHTAFYLAAALPFLFLFWKRWLKKGRGRDLVIFLLINAFGAAIYSTLGFIVTSWLLFGLYFLYLVFLPRKDFVDTLAYIRRFLSAVVVWFGISAWWIIPIFTTAPALLSVQHTTAENVTTLLSLKSQSAIPYSIQGVNPFYLFQEMDWGEIYSDKLFLLLPWALVSLAVLGVIRGLGERKYFFWSLLFIFSLFLAKGAAAPFGDLITLAFTKFFVLGALRNPFEKIGILIPFSYAILVPSGVLFAKQLLYKAKYGIFIFTILTSFAILLNIFVWAWPSWKGTMFGSKDIPAAVAVEASYLKADGWIASQKRPGRILHLPLTVGEAIGYDWNHGYHGVEPSQLLFTSNPSISHGFNLSYVDDALKTLQETLRPGNGVEAAKLKQLFSSLGIRYVVLHMDVIPVTDDIDRPERLLPVVDKIDFLEKKAEFGNLIIYEVSEDVEKDVIYLASSYDRLILGKGNELWPWLLKDADLLVTTLGDSDIDLDANATIIVPTNSFNTPPAPIAFRESVLDELPAVRFLPTSRFYPLIRVKEFLETSLVFGRNKLVIQITLSSKRLSEAMRVKLKDNSYQIEALLSDYSKIIDEIFPQLANTFLYEEPELEAVFARQLVVLGELANLSDDPGEGEVILETALNLKRHLARLGLHPFFEVKETEDLSVFDRRVFSFEVEVSGDYQIMMARKEKDKPGKLLSYQVDDKVFRREGKVSGNFRSEACKTGCFVNYGEVFLDKGYHEISYNFDKISIDLPTFDKWSRSSVGEFTFTDNGKEVVILSPTHEPGFIELPLTEPKSESVYIVEFDFWIQNGSGPKVQARQDTDLVVKNKRVLGLDKMYIGEDYFRFWRHASSSFKTKENASELSIRIEILPWDDCEVIYAHAKGLCRDLEFKKKFQRPSKVVIKGLKIIRISEPPIYLKGDRREESQDDLFGKVNFSKNSPVAFQGTFDISQPGFFVFSETFDSGWQLVLSKEKERIEAKDKVLVNLFANGWFIKAPGEYKFELKYTPQNKLRLGVFLGSIVLVGLLWYTKKQWQK